MDAFWRDHAKDMQDPEYADAVLIARLHAACAAHAQDFLPCHEQGDDLPPEHWCERCTAAARLAVLGDE